MPVHCLCVNRSSDAAHVSSACAAFVAQVGAHLGAALCQLSELRVRRVDVSPWTLLYPTAARLGPYAALDESEWPCSGCGSRSNWHPERPELLLHEGLTITNAPLCGESYSVSSPLRLRDAFVAPEVLQGEPHTAASAMFTLGCVLHLLLRGEPPPRTGGSTSVGSGSALLLGSDTLGETFSPEAAEVIDCLLRVSPHERMDARTFVRSSWVSAAATTKEGVTKRRVEGAAFGCTTPGVMCSRVAVAPNAQPDAVLLLQSHQRLAKWHANFLYETLSKQLEAMATPCASLDDTPE